MALCLHLIKAKFPYFINNRYNSFLKIISIFAPKGRKRAEKISAASPRNIPKKKLIYRNGDFHFFKRNLLITLMLTKDLANKRFEVGSLRVNEITGKVIATGDEKLFWNACFVTRQLKMKVTGLSKNQVCGGGETSLPTG